MFYLVQAGTALQVVTESGTIYQTITLPGGVSIDATLRARIVAFLQKVYVANSPSKNLWIDPATFSCFLLGILPSAATPVATAGAAGVLTGDYKYVYTFIHKITGVVMNESPPSPVSNTITLATQKLHGTLATTPAGDWTGRRVYRTAAGGDSYFQSIDIDDKTSTTFDDNTTDDALGVLPLDLTVINAPGGSDGSTRFKLFEEWKNYLWGVVDSADLVDTVYFSLLNQPWAWSADNAFPASPSGEDEFGIVAFAKRRDALGILKRTRLLKITGSSDEDFQILTVVEQAGCVAPDSVVVIRDKAYWLGQDGVYRWDDSGVVRISEDAVDPWFSGDDEGNDVFDRTQFSKAVGSWNPRTNCYELSLVPVGSTTLDQWIAFDIQNGVWFGPHKTRAFTASARGLLRTDDAVLRPAIGGTDGFLYLQNQTGASDIDGPTQTSFGIEAFFVPRWFNQGNPTMTHFWGRVSLLSRVETAGALSVTPTAGRVGETAQAAFTFDLTLGREITQSPIGNGELCQLRFSQDVVGEQFLVYGFQITPVFDVGLR